MASSRDKKDTEGSQQSSEATWKKPTRPKTWPPKGRCWTILHIQQEVTSLKKGLSRSGITPNPAAESLPCAIAGSVPSPHICNQSIPWFADFRLGFCAELNCIIVGCLSSWVYAEKEGAQTTGAERTLHREDRNGETSHGGVLKKECGHSGQRRTYSRAGGSPGRLADFNDRQASCFPSLKELHKCYTAIVSRRTAGSSDEVTGKNSQGGENHESLAT